jgi:hypothetical protein
MIFREGNDVIVDPLFGVRTIKGGAESMIREALPLHLITPALISP